MCCCVDNYFLRVMLLMLVLVVLFCCQDEMLYTFCVVCVDVNVAACELVCCWNFVFCLAHELNCCVLEQHQQSVRGLCVLSLCVKGGCVACVSVKHTGTREYSNARFWRG